MAAGSLPGASASADSATVVRGTAFPPGPHAQLSVVGCDDVFAGAAEPVRPLLGLATGAGATGERSLGFDTAGGSAAGFVGYVDSVAATSTAGLSVRAPGGTTGVAYVGYQAPADAGAGRMWIGRAALAAPASPDWTPVDLPGLTYTWMPYDLTTRQPVGGPVGAAGVADFVGSNGGDGYGFYAAGFGCDGSPFNIDAWRIGSPGAIATYDVEGYGTRTSIAGPAAAEPGQRVTLTGRVVDDLGAPASRARVVLQALTDGTWQTVRVVVGASVAATVRVQETTTYRWAVFSTPSTEGSVSDPLTVKVDPPERTTPPSTPSAPSEPRTRAAEPSQSPSQTPSRAPSEAPSETPTETLSQTPSETPTEAPSPTPGETLAPVG